MTRTMIAALLASAALPSIAHAQASAAPFTSVMRYDAARRVTGTIAADPDGAGPLHHAATRNTYDVAGRLIRVETGELATWQSDAVAPANWTGFTVQRQTDTSYDAMDRKLVDRVSANGTTYGVTQYSYDQQGLLACTAVRMNPAAFASLPASACTYAAPPAGGEPDRITRNVYDAAGQLVQVRRAVGTALEQAYETYSYTPDGKREFVIDSVGNRARLTWDGFDRQAQWQFPSAAKPSGYDGSTPVQALVTAGTVNTADYEQYGYDAAGNRTTLRKRDGRTLGFSYDALNRMTVKTVPDGCAPIGQGTCPVAAATRDIFYSYDLFGHQTAARFDSATGADAVLSGYDGFGQLTSTTTSMAGMSRTLTFASDADGNRTQVQHPDGTTFAYNYDGLDRLANVTLGGAQVAGIAYDSEGRRLSTIRGAVTSSYAYTAANGTVDDQSGRPHLMTDDLAGAARDVTTTFAYNPAGQIVTRTRDNDAYAYTGASNANVAYTANGLNQYTAVGSAAPTYDANGNLTSDGATSYGYDAENRLVSSSAGASLSYDPLGRLWQVSGGTAPTTRFLYDGDQLTAEYDASGNLLRRYVHATGEDDPLLWYEGAGLTDRRSLQVDHQGSIVSTADAGGTALAVNSYDEYGVPASGNLGRFQYTGQAWLPSLGMYHYKARIYAPKLGRFLQTDPVGYDDQVNLYAYVANDPVNGRDPTGLEGDDDWNKRVVDVVIGTAKVATGAVLTAAGIAGDGASAAAEVGTAGAATPVAVPAAVASTAVAATGIAMAADGAAQIGGAIMRSTPAGSDGGGSNDGGNSGKGGGQSSGGTPRNLGNLGGRASERAADVATSRGASGANVRQMGQWADKPLSEVARAAASGDRSAATALKIVKQASRLGQKY